MSMRFVFQGPASHQFRVGAARLLPLLALAVTVGCGGLREKVEVRSSPEEAYVYVNGRFSGNTPADLKLKRQIPHRLEFRKVGYRTREIQLMPEYGDGERPFFRVAPFENAGAYVTLRPNPVEVELIHEMVPAAPAVGDRISYNKDLRAVDDALATGDLTEEEAELVREQLKRAYFPEGLPSADS